jgi:hypothetical protein
MTLTYGRFNTLYAYTAQALGTNGRYPLTSLTQDIFREFENSLLFENP